MATRLKTDSIAAVFQPTAEHPLMTQPQAAINQKSIIPDNRPAAFFDIIQSSLAIKSSEQFCAWVGRDLQHIFPHGMMICGMAEIQKSGFSVQHIISCNFPHEYVATLRQPGGATGSPIITQWLKTQSPVLFEIPSSPKPSAWLDNFKNYGLHNMAAHGLCDVQNNATSYFAFAKIPGKLNRHHAEMLELLVPHLHQTLVRVLKIAKNKTPTPQTTLRSLSARESEILKWLSLGKTNEAIAERLGISPHTVKNHVQRILNKLHAKNRTQAVAQALLSQQDNSAAA